MFPFLASALLILRRTAVDESVELTEPERPHRVSPLALVPPLPTSAPMMNGGPTPLSKSLTAMLDVLKRYVLPPFLEPPPAPPLPPASALLASVVERTVGLGSRVGTDIRGPFSVAALKGLRVEAVVRYEVWAHAPAEVGTAIEGLINNVLGEREVLRTEGFLRVALKSAGASENIFAEDAWRQSVEFDVLFEFPYVDADGAESLIARIPIDMVGEFSESTAVVDEMARWDNELALSLALRGPLTIGALSALAFIAGNEPTGTVVVTRTFDGATGAPAAHPSLSAFVTAVGGDSPAERHAEVTFASLSAFFKALTSFKLTDEALAGMAADAVPQSVLDGLEPLKGQEIGGEDQFISLVETAIGPADTAAFKSEILKHASTSTPMTMGDWDENNVADEYQSFQFRVRPPIRLAGVADRFEVTYVDPTFDPVKLDKVAIVYLRASQGLPT